MNISDHRAGESSLNSNSPTVVDVKDLKTWDKIQSRDESGGGGILEQLAKEKKIHEISPFPYAPELNHKVALWANGDISALICHAVVNVVNENFSDKLPQSQRIMHKAGPGLRQYIREHIKICRTGDAKLTQGFNLPAKYIIHTVGPKYNQKYMTAAESALFSCYSKVLQISVENKIRTIGLPCINTMRRGYPPHDGAHLALRIVRRFLEKHSNSVDLIVFCVEDLDIGIYELLMPLYFPRSEQEEQYGLYYLPKDIGGPEGQPMIPERQIRIIDKPMSLHSSNLSSTVGVAAAAAAAALNSATSSQVITAYRGPKSHVRKDSSPDTDGAVEATGDAPSDTQWDDLLDDERETNFSSAKCDIHTGPSGNCDYDSDDDGLMNVSVTVDLSSGLELSIPVGKTTFAKMNADVDKRLKNGSILEPGNYSISNMLLNNSNQETRMTQECHRTSRYNRLLKKCREKDFAEMMALKWVYLAGNDRLGRPVVVFFGRKFRHALINKEDALLYLIQIMDKIVNREYVVIYLHTLTAAEDHPSLSFVEEIYDQLDYRYKHNLKALYWVHPSGFWSRFYYWWFTIKSQQHALIKNKVYLIGSLDAVDSVVNLSQLDLPNYVYSHDFKVNGVPFGREVKVEAEVKFENQGHAPEAAGAIESSDILVQASSSQQSQAGL